MQPLLQDAAVLGCLSFARPLMNLSSIRVFARLRAGLHDAGHAVNRTAKGSICRIYAPFAEIKALRTSRT